SQSTATTVTVSGGGVMTRIGEYREDWHTHNNALADVIQLGKTQFGQQVALYVTSMGGNVQQLGASLRAQGKTLNQAYDDSMAAAFQDLGGKTKASWAQAEQVMAQGLDKYYQSMRQTTTRDYDSLQQITAQLINDGYNHRSDLEKRDSERLKQLTEQYMTDKNNGLIDTSKGNINRLSQDMAKFFMDMKDHNSSAIAADIRQLGKDTEGNIDNMFDKVDKHQSERFDQEIAQSQADITRIIQQDSTSLLNALPGSGHAQGGYISGPGTGTSDSVLARLSNGEFVINARSTAEYRPLLEAINNRFASGGYVDPVEPRALGDQKTFVEMLGLMSAMQRAQGALAGAGAGVQGKWAGSVAQWIQQAMTIDRVSGADWFSGLEIIIGHESGGNPNAINLSDSNAAAGDPSRGLMQTIGSTFAAYHAPGTSTNIYDPVANIAAGIRYIESVYHGIDNVPGVRSVRGGGAYLPYDNGGWLPPSGMPVNGLRKPEAVLTPDQSEALIVNAEYIRAQRTAGSEPGTSKQVNIYFTGTQYPNVEQMAALKREMALALGGV
ncbi:lytic transglycosylase domain-containing protein, partial [Streptomyces sp. NPDC001118]